MELATEKSRWIYISKKNYVLYILKILITSIAGHQFIVGSLFHNFSILDKQDLVYILNRGQPVCNHDNCFAPHQFLESLLQLVFIFRICSCRSLIHNDDMMRRRGCSLRPF